MLAQIAVALCAAGREGHPVEDLGGGKEAKAPGTALPWA